MRQELILRSPGSTSGPRAVPQAGRWHVTTLIVGSAAFPQILGTRHATSRLIDCIHDFDKAECSRYPGWCSRAALFPRPARSRELQPDRSLLRRVRRSLTGLFVKIGICEADAMKGRSGHTRTGGAA